jgi:HTH-type transcriptional regulator, sugar sensing transcriptional regulator
MTSALVPFGFTELESAAYTFLLRESPATGYRVAQGIGRAVANTYKAIESLRLKGAVMIEKTEGKLIRAVPAEELLGSLEAEFSRRRRSAARALSSITAAPEDDAVYRLTSAAQVYERCRAMLRGAESVVVLDLFPSPFAAVRAEIERCVARGVMVAMQVYEPVEVRGADIVVSPRAAAVFGRWDGAWLNVVRDSTEHLVALLTPDGASVRHATATTSPFLSHIAYSGLVGEIAAARLQRAIDEGGDPRRVVRSMRRYTDLSSTGVRALSTTSTRAGRASRSRA